MSTQAFIVTKGGIIVVETVISPQRSQGCVVVVKFQDGQCAPTSTQTLTFEVQ